MQVLKFGGTSIGSTTQIKKAVEIINFRNNNIIVLSAFSEVTNLLSEFVKQSKCKNNTVSKQILETIKSKHIQIVNELISSKKLNNIAIKKINSSISLIEHYLNQEISSKDENIILAQGEILSAMIIYLYILELGIDVVLLPATIFMKTNATNEPDYQYIASHLSAELHKFTECKLFITNGFICKNHKNEIDNLGRGGSDFSATIIGKTLNANLIEIWTDINGLHNNDPRYVKHTQSIQHLSYEEASELAYFGAKVLHPSSITPARNNGIPLLIKNTMNPMNPGTVISDYTIDEGLKAIAAKDGITTIKIRSGRMMQAYGFLRKIFEVFEKYKTSVDMLTTSEISVAMTIDNTSNLDNIVKELSLLGIVETEINQSIICIVGNFNNKKNKYIKEIITGLDKIPIQMISFGSSNINISFVINSKYKIEALNLLNQHIYKSAECLMTN